MDHKVFYKKGIKLKYFPDEKVLMLDPGKSNKDDFLRLKSQIDTILQISGTKRVGNTFTLKLDDTFNVNIDEVLKSLGMKGGIEHEDAQSMVDDAAEDDVKDQEKEQAPQVQGQAAQAGTDMPQLESVVHKGMFYFLFEEDLFQATQPEEKRKNVKRYGEYWKPIEGFTGKNRQALKPEDILDVRRKFSIKPVSNDRDIMLRSLDKAENYFYGRLEKIKGPEEAEDFHQDYLSIDNLRPEDYGDEDNIDQPDNNANMQDLNKMSIIPNFDDIDYEDVNIEDE